MRKMRRTPTTFAAAFAIALACVIAPAQAHAATGDYSIDELSTQITVETNASARIVEHQVLTFDTRNEGVTWYLHVPEDGESVRIASVRVAPVDDGGTLLGDWMRLQMIDSDPSRQGRNPGDTAAYQFRTQKSQPWYSYNIGDGMVRCWFPLEGSIDDPNRDEAAEPRQTYAIEIDYTIAHRIRIYRDVAELYWRYVNDSLPADADNVNLQVTLPIPAGLDLETARSEITAWGHGPTDGRFAIGEDGSVTYHMDHIARGNYAEAHIIFPASWETNVPDNGLNQFSELRRAAAEAEEAKWVDVGLREAAWDNKVRVVFLAFALLIILIAAINITRYGRTPHSRRTLVRTAATFAITALAAHLFFREPLTVNALGLLALAAALASLAFPTAPITPTPDNGDVAHCPTPDNGDSPHCPAEEPTE